MEECELSGDPYKVLWDWAVECYSGIQQWAGKGSACNCQLDVCFLCLVSPLHLGGKELLLPALGG